MPTIEIKPVEKWTNKDLLIYFSHQLKNLNGVGLKIPPPAWMPMMGRIKTFREKHNISAADYKKYIDSLFTEFLNDPKYVPAFGSLVTEKVYFAVKKLQNIKAVKGTTDSEFERLRRQLYTNNVLFSHL